MVVLPVYVLHISTVQYVDKYTMDTAVNVYIRHHT